MLIKKPELIRASQITPQDVYLSRRRFLRGAAGGVLAAGAGAVAVPWREAPASPAPMKAKRNDAFSTDEDLTSYEDVTTYNNFYEFGTDKADPARHARDFEPRPWSVTVSGECEKPGVVDLEDLMRPHALEERVYRLRCVEAWSMVIPWIGFPLGPVLARFAPTSRAKYVEFRTLYDPDRMPGQRRGFLDWPYREGLRMDEAMHPLTILAVGLYGKEMPNQNGAPLRLVVPWKYGFKSIKSIVDIRFTEKMPATTWNMENGREYGFYSNVNPKVDHPRWSQGKERRIGEGIGGLAFLTPKIETRMFNGYEEQVASLYAGMDLRKNY